MQGTPPHRPLLALPRPPRVLRHGLADGLDLGFVYPPRPRAGPAPCQGAGPAFLATALPGRAGSPPRPPRLPCLLGHGLALPAPSPPPAGPLPSLPESAACVGPSMVSCATVDVRPSGSRPAGDGSTHESGRACVGPSMVSCGAAPLPTSFACPFSCFRQEGRGPAALCRRLRSPAPILSPDTPSPRPLYILSPVSPHHHLLLLPALPFPSESHRPARRQVLACTAPATLFVDLKRHDDDAIDAYVRRNLNTIL